MKKLLSLAACGVSYSEGSRIGVVQKLSRKGITCKTWEGELALQGITSDSEGRAIPNVWAFSVKDESLLPELREAMASGKRVEVHYDQVLAQWPCEGDTSYFARSVK